MRTEEVVRHVDDGLGFVAVHDHMKSLSLVVQAQGLRLCSVLRSLCHPSHWDLYAFSQLGVHLCICLYKWYMFVAFLHVAFGSAYDTTAWDHVFV